LIKQHSEDPNCALPMPPPSLESVKNHYKTLLSRKPNEIPGRDFLYSMAYNYDVNKQHHAHSMFWESLVKSFPFYKEISMPVLDNNTTYLESLHTIFSKMKPQKSLQSIRQQLSYYKSGCMKKTYKGKTCKKVGINYTKNRDRKRTYRLTHSRLL
jgi:hypothetical protein